ncbi:hypothetical protein PPERSA_01479 [Pseudocohnilembus persalinus]|uniref:Uncharacterized protein n=1 Tax=Pseudocohnilembus persalinus TaxID=266149 RepID=A0A0V0QHD6_PSEPJ|nr:hypothetical protein PPERSA_01479 [Pseudocohnilembus persalinus]|eukprot:KRX01576.1 hypothetical protein PPERSA_01479 [Pseudocohnilembus persalinus]
MKDFLTHASQSIQEAQAIKTTENFEMEPNENKLNSYIRFIISDKPFQEITNIFKSFWEYLPSDINIINPLINYFFCLASNQINYTHFENFNQLTDYVFGSAGYKFGISYYKKCKFDPNQNYDIQTLAKISDILQRQNKDLPQIYMGFIPHIAHSLSPLLFTNKKDIEADLDIKFIENMVEEIIKVLELISEEQIIDDENGQIFNICLELSKLDDILNQCDQTRVLNYYQVLGKALNTWLIKFDDNQKEILYKCLQNEKWDHSEGNKIYTDIVIDYCSLLFKSVDMLKQILSISKENEFKKLIQNKLQAQIFKAVKTYKEFVKKSLKNLVQPQNDQQQQFVQYTGKPTQLIYLTEDQQIHNLTIFKSLCYRLGNLNFIEEQLRVGYLQHFKQDKQLVVQIEESFKETEQYCCKTIAYNLVHVFLKESFCEHLYSEFDSQFFNSVMVEKFQVQYPKSFTNLTHEFDDYMKMIKKRIPKQIIPKIGVEIINNIGIVFQRATVDLNKLDMPIDHEDTEQIKALVLSKIKADNITEDQINMVVNQIQKIQEQ